MTRVAAIIQARTGSTRLPGKVLLPVAGRPMLSCVVERVRRAALLDDVIVATTTLGEDDPIEDLALDRAWPLTRGSPTDLLDRYVAAAREHDVDVVVRITSDCPLIDPGLVDETVRAFLDDGVDYASNTLEPRTYPRGLDVEVVSREALERAWEADDDPASREHATPYIYRHPDRFRLRRVAGDENHSAHRWTVDTPEDLELVRRIYAGHGRDAFDWRDTLALVGAHPAWAAINRDVVQKELPPA